MFYALYLVTVAMLVTVKLDSSLKVGPIANTIHGVEGNERSYTGNTLWVESQGKAVVFETACLVLD